MTAVADEPGDHDDEGMLPASAMQGGPGHDLALLRDREAKALRLRRLGGTYAQIAQEMGFADASGARQLIMRALDRTVGESSTALRALENERLDTEVQVLTTIMLDGQAKAVDKIRAADALTRVGARRARLNGLDAPVQIAVGAGSLAELDDALALLESTVQHVTGEVVESHELGPDEPAGGPGSSEGERSPSDD